MKYRNDTKKLLTDAVFLFLTGAFIGWVYEVVLRLCGLIGFGVAGCAFVFVLLPLLKKQYLRVPEKIRFRLAAVLLIVFFADLLMSLLCPNMGFGITNY